MSPKVYLFSVHSPQSTPNSVRVIVNAGEHWFSIPETDSSMDLCLDFDIQDQTKFLWGLKQILTPFSVKTQADPQ